MSESAKILVVAEDEASRCLLRVTLGAAGYEVSEAMANLSSLEEARTNPIDLIVFDVGKGASDGWSICAKMRADPLAPNVPIVALTARNDQATHELAMASGADDFLAKPVSSTELLLRVRSLLRIRSVTRELETTSALVRAQHQTLVDCQVGREELAALVVHDLKSPITCIVANTQFVLDDPALDSSLCDPLSDVISAAQSMHRMVMNLLDISRSESGALVPKQTHFDLAELLEQVCRGMQRRAKEARKELLFQDIEGARDVHADQDIVRRVLENLVENAIHYTPANTTISVNVSFHEAWVAISVEDQGPGVPLDMRDRIFEKFVQIDPPAGEDASAHASGRGLGLAFCKLAMQAHGGRIWIEDRLPRGAAFCLQLPG